MYMCWGMYILYSIFIAFINDLFWCHIKQVVNVFIRAIVKIFSLDERCNFPFHWAIFTVALMNIHFL